MLNKSHILGIFLVAGILLLGCTGGIPGVGGGSGGSGDPLSLIPAKANAYVEVKLKDVLNDPEVKAQMAASGTNYEQSLAQIKAMGVDPLSVDKLVIFMDVNDQSSAGYVGFIAKVKIDEAKFIAAANKQAKEQGGSEFTKTTYGTASIYTSKGGTGGLVFLPGDIVAVGATEQVAKDIADVSSGKAKAMNSATLTAVRGKLDSSAMIIAVAELPASAKASLKQQPDAQGGISFQSFKSLQAGGLSMSKSGDTYSYVIAGKLGSEADATQSKKVIDSTITLYGQALEGQQGGEVLTTVLKNLQTSVSGDTLVLSLKITKQQIQDLQALMAASSGAGSGYNSGSTGYN
ncbi:Uncharacterised protein [Candidatus Gugararchaeum adminiculabundum]|nr:Uncharacterised protein [Candidatus Gugararchaeum adminiculabundum]